MNSQEIREKLEKALETVEKKRGTLEKYRKKEEKITALILSKGWKLEEGGHQKYGTEEHHDCYWTFCDLRDAQDGIERTEQAIKEKTEIAEKWEARLKEAEEKEQIMEKEFPEVFREYQKTITDMWDKWDLKEQERLRAEHKALGYKEFMRKYKYSSYEMLYKTEEEIHKENVKSAETLIMNLWKRVKDIVGTPTDYSGLFVRIGNEWEGAVINGFVIGTDGTASVETISAGGWNIQRYHYRTLVHKY